MNGEVPDIFGNYLLKGKIVELTGPDASGFWPLAPGWYVILGLLGFGLGFYIARLGLRYWRNCYRRAALAEIDRAEKSSAASSERLSPLPQILKRVALSTYPRQSVASLTGQAWLSFLDQHYAGPSFRSGLGEQLLTIAYRPTDAWPGDKDEVQALVNMVRLWIETHTETCMEEASHV